MSKPNNIRCSLLSKRNNTFFNIKSHNLVLHTTLIAYCKSVEADKIVAYVLDEDILPANGAHNTIFGTLENASYYFGRSCSLQQLGFEPNVGTHIGDSEARLQYRFITKLLEHKQAYLNFSDRPLTSENRHLARTSLEMTPTEITEHLLNPESHYTINLIYSGETVRYNDFVESLPIVKSIRKDEYDIELYNNSTRKLHRLLIDAAIDDNVGITHIVQYRSMMSDSPVLACMHNAVTESTDPLLTFCNIPALTFESNREISPLVSTIKYSSVMVYPPNLCTKSQDTFSMLTYIPTIDPPSGVHIINSVLAKHFFDKSITQYYNYHRISVKSVKKALCRRSSSMSIQELRDAYRAITRDKEFNRFVRYVHLLYRKVRFQSGFDNFDNIVRTVFNYYHIPKADRIISNLLSSKLDNSWCTEPSERPTSEFLNMVGKYLEDNPLSGITPTLLNTHCKNLIEHVLTNDKSAENYRMLRLFFIGETTGMPIEELAKIASINIKTRLTYWKTL